MVEEQVFQSALSVLRHVMSAADTGWICQLRPRPAACLAPPAARGQIDLEAPVRRYIPDFCAPDVTLRDVLMHRSGVTLPVFMQQPERWSDWNNVVAALAEEPPAYPRGTLAYQPIAFGWILTEILQRVTGGSLHASPHASSAANFSGKAKRRAPTLIGWANPSTCSMAPTSPLPSSVTTTPLRHGRRSCPAPACFLVSALRSAGSAPSLRLVEHGRGRMLRPSRRLFRRRLRRSANQRGDRDGHQRQ